jgi:hypothetical protein
MHTFLLLSCPQVCGPLFFHGVEQVTCRLLRLLRMLRWQQQALSVRWAYAAAVEKLHVARHARHNPPPHLRCV